MLKMRKFKFTYEVEISALSEEVARKRLVKIPTLQEKSWAQYHKVSVTETKFEAEELPVEEAPAAETPEVGAAEAKPKKEPVIPE